MAVQTNTQSENRWQEIIEIWRSNQWLFVVIGYVIGLLTFPLLQEIITNLAGLLSGFVPEAVGIGFTVIFIDRLNQQREEKRRIKDLQERLVREAGSTVNSIAVHAINELRNHDWLEGENGLLQNTNLRNANLANANLNGANLAGSELRKANLAGARLNSVNLIGADLSNANLRGTDLQKSNLEGTTLDRANLAGAYLKNTNLEGTAFWYANLAGADLGYANLANAILSHANLADTNLKRTKFRDADLHGANLAGANLMQAEFDRKTMLPDASYNYISKTANKYWTPDTDMTRYTNPKHPDFWQPDWVKDQEE